MTTKIKTPARTGLTGVTEEKTMSRLHRLLLRILGIVTVRVKIIVKRG